MKPQRLPVFRSEVCLDVLDTVIMMNKDFSIKMKWKAVDLNILIVVAFRNSQRCFIFVTVCGSNRKTVNSNVGCFGLAERAMTLCLIGSVTLFSCPERRAGSEY